MVLPPKKQLFPSSLKGRVLRYLMISKLDVLEYKSDKGITRDLKAAEMTNIKTAIMSLPEVITFSN